MDDKKLVRALLRALHRLAPEQGRIARRNARAEVRKAVRKIEAAMDDAYPAVRKAPSARHSSDPQARERRQRAAGWRRIHENPHTAAALAAAGVPVKAIGDSLWVPPWVLGIPANDIPRLKRARKPAERETVAAEVAILRAGSVGLSPAFQRAAIARCKRDRAFTQALLAAASAGLPEVRSVVEMQADLQAIVHASGEAFQGKVLSDPKGRMSL